MKTETAMKKLVGLLIVMNLAASVHAGLDISFSSINEGHWSYTASGTGEGTFSFTEAGVDTVQETDTALPGNMFVNIPDLYISSLIEETVGGSYGFPEMKIYIGNIDIREPEPSTITITNGKGGGNGSNILTGVLDSGIIVIVGTTASLYPTFTQDITSIKWEDWADGPTSMDFALTVQGGDDIASMIRDGENNTIGGTFSGSITVPEPATMFILAIGSVLLWKNKK
jgi:hypothetical protein